MTKRQLTQIVHGADYNPEQWIEYPAVLKEDLRLMKLARVNCMTLGVFSWASLEPREGYYTFDWLDEVIGNLTGNGQNFILSTPSGGKPNWLALKYEEVRKCDPQGRREPQYFRHNHCWSSPIYREKVRNINTRLAERYGSHPGLVLWHVSNELGNSSFQGRCYCQLCFSKFHAWLKERYETVDNMNAAWWSRVWSHTYASFEEVSYIDESVHGLDLAWKRFTTDQIASFLANEIVPLRQISPHVPVTTNLMGTSPAYDQRKIVPLLDVASWNSYPLWHCEGKHEQQAISTAWTHDLNRSLKHGKPFLLMESTPSQVNWTKLSPLKRPGMHRVASLQAVAHGGDGVLYFQFRQSRGSFEKFHGAIVTHAGHEHARVFREVAALGEDLQKLDRILGATTPAKVAMLFDWDNQWAIGAARMPRNENKDYCETQVAHYEPFWRHGVPVDVIDSTDCFDDYNLVVAPMLYLLRPNVAERLEAFVLGGGTLVTTYLSGLVDAEDLCFLGGFPPSLQRTLGIEVEETDVLADQQIQQIIPSKENLLGLPPSSQARHFCDILQLHGAQVIATYGNEFYAGTPAVTVNHHGNGSAYYIASRNDPTFLNAFTAGLIRDLGLTSATGGPLPQKVSATMRVKDGMTFMFLLNFDEVPQTVVLPVGKTYHDILRNKDLSKSVTLDGFGALVMHETLPTVSRSARDLLIDKP